METKPLWQRAHEALFPIAVWMAVWILIARFFYLQFQLDTAEGSVIDDSSQLPP